MAYEPVTTAQFKTAKPQFAAVPDVTVQQYLDMAGIWVDASWAESTYQPAIIALACHLMTLEGLGTDPASVANKSGLYGFESIKSGTLTLTRARGAGVQSDYKGWITSTPCGEFFYQLLRLNKAGPRVAVVSTAACLSPYAKDWPGPVYGWPGVFQ